jgi:serine/threonine-protein kinase
VLEGLRQFALPALNPGDEIAGYLLIHELGRGGMSEVWLAQRADGKLKREVAIKLPLNPAPSMMLAARFARERDVLASLVHPHITRLYDAGISTSGRPFIVLEAVQGSSIIEYADVLALTLSQRLQLFLQVLAAVDHAHRHMVVHRDLKPGNILVTDDGQVKLLDFGIAKLLAADAETGDSNNLTLDLGSVLTPRYAAPEQILGGPITAATDIYAAGVVLYELMTGVPPYAAGLTAVAAVTQAVLDRVPLPPSRADFCADHAHARGHRSVAAMRQALRGDVDTALQVALEKTPASRYASIERFADDLRRIVDSQPITARPPTLFHRLRLMVRRNRSASALVSGVSLALLVAAGLAWQQREASREQAARTATVREFIFQMVSDAETDESQPDAEVTGRQMVDAAVARAQAELAEQPRLQGELLVELGRVYTRLRQQDQAVSTLTRAIALLARSGPPDEPALNKGRGHLAGQLAGTDPVRAEALARDAIASCSRPDGECAKARGYARQTLVTLENQRGRPEQALAEARNLVRDFEQGFGPEDQNTAAAMQDLAVIERNLARFSDAAKSIARAVELTRRTRMRTQARMTMLRTQALIELDLGHFDTARRQLGELVPRTQDKSERALLYRLIANAWLQIGDPGQAVRAAAQAIALAAEAGDGFERLLSMQAEARANALLGRFDVAEATHRQVIKDLIAQGMAPDSKDVLRARRYAAEVRLRRGDLVAADAELQAIAAAHQLGSPEQGLEWAHTQDLLGCIARARGADDLALKYHFAARDKLAALLAEGHFFLLRNGLYQDLARRAAQNQLAQSRDRYLRELPADSIWRSIINATTVGLGGPSTQGERPLAVL